MALVNLAGKRVPHVTGA